MGSNRTKLAVSIQARVLTRSRRRCCICFGLSRDLDVKQGQIAHLDKNRGNDAVDNLAFLCLPHHDQYDSVTSQSKSFRPAEVKVYRDELYDYFSPFDIEGTSPEALQKDLTKALLLEISLIPHEWKNGYMAIYPGHFAEGTFERTKDYSDVWDVMADVASHQYSEKEWERYLHLFSEGTGRTIDKLERVMMMFRGEIPTIVKLAILRTNSQLRTEFRGYQLVPRLAEEGQDSDSIFAERFRSVLRVLGELSRLADRERDIQ